MVRGSTVAVELLCKGTFFPNAGDMLQEVLLHARCRWQAKAKPGLLQGSQRTFMPPRSLLGSAAWQWLGCTLHLHARAHQKTGKSGCRPGLGRSKGSSGTEPSALAHPASTKEPLPHPDSRARASSVSYTCAHTHSCTHTLAASQGPWVELGATSSHM